MVTEDSSPSQERSRASPFWAAFFRPPTFLPQEHGGWFLFLTPLAVGLAVGGAWNGRAAAFVVAALATFLIRQPLDLALRSLAGKRPRADLPAVATWLGIYAVLAALAGGYLLLGARLWGMLPLGGGRGSAARAATVGSPRAPGAYRLERGDQHRWPGPERGRCLLRRHRRLV